MKDAAIRFYIDADVLGLAKVLGGLRHDTTYAGDPGSTIHKHVRPPCEITSPHVDDVDWLPVTARNGWLVITRDSKIREHRAEIEAVRNHGARLIALAGSEAVNTWAQLEIVMCRWRSIEELVSAPAPFIYTATRTALGKIELA